MATTTTPVVERQLRSVLPDLREALEHGWRLRPILAASGLDRRLLQYLEQLGAVTPVLSRPGKRRPLRWSWTGSEPELVTRLLTFPAYRYPRWRSSPARYVRLKRDRPCQRCAVNVPASCPALKITQGKATFYLCRTCTQPSDVPLHERELEALRAELERLTLLWPQELPVYASRLRNVGELLRAAFRTAPRRARTSNLLQLGCDLVEVGDWLAATERKLTPYRHRLLESETQEVAVQPLPYELAEVVGEDPRPYRPGPTRQQLEQKLRDRARQQEHRHAADLLHYGLIHATSWLRDLYLRLEARRQELTY